jgi:sugar lactone lactonase YvrE
MDTRIARILLFTTLGAGALACDTFDSELTAPGYEVEIVATGLAYPDGLGYAPDGALLVTEEYRGGGVVRIDLGSGVQTHLVRDLADPDNIVVVGDDIYVTEEDVQGRVVKIDAAGEVTTFVSGLSNPEGLDRGPDGHLYLAEHATAGHVYRFAMDGARETFAPVTDGEGIRCLPGGSLVVAETSHDRVVRIAPGGSRALITEESMTAPDGLAYDPALDRVLVTEDASPGRLLAVDLATGAMSIVAYGMDAPQTMLVEPDGAILVAEQGASRIVRLRRDPLAQEGQLR